MAGVGKVVKFFRKPSQGNRALIPDDLAVAPDVSDFRERGDAVEEFKERMAQSLSRTKSRIFELAASNPWDWFFTGTLNGEWHDRANLEEFRKKLSQYIRDCRKKYGTPCAFLLIPEQHKNGCWHVHGLLGGFPETAFRPFSLQEKLPQRIRKLLLAGEDVRDWSGYSSRFGFTTVTPVKRRQRVSSYITKYITKDCYKTAISNGGHMFYASQGLRSKTLAFEGKQLPQGFDGVRYDFQNDYVAIADISSLPASLKGGE